MFLVGPNASGKSNFLDAIRFLRDVAKARGRIASRIGRARWAFQSQVPAQRGAAAGRSVFGWNDPADRTVWFVLDGDAPLLLEEPEPEIRGRSSVYYGHRFFLKTGD